LGEHSPYLGGELPCLGGSSPMERGWVRRGDPLAPDGSVGPPSTVAQPKPRVRP
jgi:hypothetical protein